MSQQTSTPMFKVKIEQPVATPENTSPEAVRVHADRWRDLEAAQAADGYAFSCSYRGISTFSKVSRTRPQEYPDRYFTTNLAHQLVPCDRWGYALTEVC